MSQTNKIRYDVFISYSTVDRTFTTQLKHLLEQSGLRVWFDADSGITGGDRILEAISDGVLSSQTVVAVFSRAALKSQWASDELLMQYQESIKDKTRKLIPIWIEDVESEVPLHFQILHALDFRGVDLFASEVLETKAWRELLASIRKVLPEPGVDAAGMPFVVLAMTKPELEELWSGDIFKTFPHAEIRDPQRLEDLREALQEHKIFDLSKYYKDHRDDWLPVACDEKPVREVVAEMVDRFNITQGKTGREIIYPQFFSTDFFSQDHTLQKETWRKLQQTGCVVIVDALSLFHPVLRYNFIQSHIGVQSNTSVVVVSPFGLTTLPINQLLEREIRSQIQAPFDRFDRFDVLCEFGVAELRSLQRWLFTILPMVQVIRPNPEQMASVEKKIESETNHKKTGIGKLIMGGRN